MKKWSSKGGCDAKAVMLYFACVRAGSGAASSLQPRELCSPPGSSAQGTFQARLQRWVAILFYLYYVFTLIALFLVAAHAWRLPMLFVSTYLIPRLASIPPLEASLSKSSAPI